MTDRLLALVDGEHYPPVVRAALRQAGEDAEVVAALLLGGSEKLGGAARLRRAAGAGRRVHAPGDALVAAAAVHGADRVVDLSDEPVVGERERIALACRALAAGVAYRGADFALRAAAAGAVDVPSLAVIGTGKRIGKTAVSGHVARVLRRWRIAMWWSSRWAAAARPSPSWSSPASDRWRSPTCSRAPAPGSTPRRTSWRTLRWPA